MVLLALHQRRLGRPFAAIVEVRECRSEFHKTVIIIQALFQSSKGCQGILGSAPPAWKQMSSATNSSIEESNSDLAVGGEEGSAICGAASKDPEGVSRNLKIMRALKEDLLFMRMVWGPSGRSREQTLTKFNVEGKPKQIKSKW